MKKLCCLVAGIVLVSSFSAFAIEADTLEDEANVMRQARTADLWFEKWSFKMSRGLINSASFWVEVPRNIYVETKQNAIIGPLKGMFKGLGLSVTRALGGVMDIATFGTVDDTYTIYDQYSVPYFVWQDWD